jgi:hypothetical protein
MIARLVAGKAGIKVLRGLHAPDRSLRILPDDRFLVSYPKSGNTWVRFLVANLLHPETPASFANIHELLPDPEGTAKRIFDRMPRPRIIKSHHCFEPRFPKVVYIVRDPRDVAVSQYHYHRKNRRIADDSPIANFVDRFLAGEVCPHGSWGTNVASWLVTRKDDPRFLLIRYEDLVERPHTELSKMAEFLGLNPDRDRIAQAIDRSSAHNMRKLEQIQHHLSTLTKDGRTDIPFVRAAASGGWKKELPIAEVAKIEQAWSPLMRYLGYTLATKVEDSHAYDLVFAGTRTRQTP